MLNNNYFCPNAGVGNFSSAKDQINILGCAGHILCLLHIVFVVLNNL